MSKDMLSKIALADLAGPMTTFWQRISGRDGDVWFKAFKRFLRKENPWLESVDETYREEGGVIYFSVTSDGTTGPEWGVRLKKQDIHLSRLAKNLLYSDNFQTTIGVTTEIVILKGNLFSDSERITSKIRAKALKRGFTKPNAEVACLIREKFSNKQIEAMGFCGIVCMHEPIQDYNSDLGLLLADHYGDSSWLSVYYDGPGNKWGRDRGFAFALSPFRK